ncbi:carbohydrate ABC transporter permease [Gorillibacterium sp. sgz500922]|uniref:carbohydrate ABC transporter permease n=1 Tax=Gorillibacterium sp. sgz500922 TaxID=3446694 RepID=UPI003F669257
MKPLERGIVSDYDLKRGSVKLGYGVMILFICIMVFSMLYPFLTTLFNGVKGNAEVNSFPPHFFPKEWHFENFHKAWVYIALPKFLRNTLYIFFGNMIVTTIVLGLAAFSLSRLNVPGQKYIYLFFMIALFIPPTTYIIPNFINLKDLHLLNTFWAFWLPAGASAFNLLILKEFFDGIHMDLIESGRIDGASEFRLFVQIAVPLSIPIFSTIAIFVFAGAWNDWYWPSLVLHNDSHYPLSTAIYKYVLNARRLDTNIKFALLSMVMLPPVLFFLFFQKYIMRGLHVGGVKG